MALEFITPENSFIQFYEVDGDGIETCNQILQPCLPIHYGYDFSFQVYVSGAVATYIRDNYVVKITDKDGDVVSDALQFDWFYDSVANRTWANLTGDFDITDLVALGNRACANFQIFQQRYVYDYVIDSWGVDDVTVELTVDGVVTPIGGVDGGFDMDELAILVDAFLGSGGNAFHTTEFGLQIQDFDGHVYGRITITNGVSTFYDPVVSEGQLIPYFISNCIQYVSDTCFTTIVKYKGSENQFGFNYELDSGFYNSARLRMYYDNPQPVFDEAYFVLSDGAKKVLSARYEKEYEVHVDFANEQRHFALAAAIKHDTVLMGRVTALTQFTAEGKYDIAWLNKPGTNIDSAPGSFRIRPSPYFQMNSNCVNT